MTVGGIKNPGKKTEKNYKNGKNPGKYRKIQKLAKGIRL